MKVKVRDLTLGDMGLGSFACFDRELDADAVRRFAEVVGDISPLHVDVDYGVSIPFDGNLVHGMLASSLFSTLVGVLLPGRNALLGEVKFSFIRPVRVSSRLTVTGAVTALLPSGAGFKLRLIAYNNGEICIRGEALVRLRPQSIGGNIAAEVELDQVWEGGPEDLRTALVTGGSGLVGREVCLQLAAAGWRVGVHFHRNKTAAEEILQEIEKEGGTGCIVKGDMSGEPEDILEFAMACKGALGPIGLLTHAACGSFAPAGWLDPVYGSEDLYATQVRGFNHLLRAVLPDMLRAQQGRILTVLSDAINPPYPRGWQSYIAAKSALRGMMGSLASDYEKCGLTVGVIAPGRIHGQSSVVSVGAKGSDVVDGQEEAGQKVSPALLAGAIRDIAEGCIPFPNGSSLSIKGDAAPQVAPRSLLEPIMRVSDCGPEDAPASKAFPQNAAGGANDDTSAPDYKRRLVSVFQRVLDLDVSIQLDAAELGSFSGWDSLNHLKLLMEVESEFDINVERAEELYSFQRLLAFVQ